MLRTDVGRKSKPYYLQALGLPQPKLTTTAESRYSAMGAPANCAVSLFFLCLHLPLLMLNPPLVLTTHLDSSCKILVPVRRAVCHNVTKSLNHIGLCFSFQSGLPPWMFVHLALPILSCSAEGPAIPCITAWSCPP